MKTIYTDENSRLRNFAELMNSFSFRNYVGAHIRQISKWDHGMIRVKPQLCKEAFNTFLKANGFEIGKRTEHANGIGNNNMNYIQDLASGEFIGALHLNSDLSGNVYCYATDINNNRVSNTYSISQHGLSLERTAWVSWYDYQFGKEEHALDVINDAIKLGILAEGPNGGVMVYKQFEDGSEGWQEVDKDFAAKDLVKQHMVDALFEQIEQRSSKRTLDEQIGSATSHRDPDSKETQNTERKEDLSR